jgi:hypothetical protein
MALKNNNLANIYFSELIIVWQIIRALSYMFLIGGGVRLYICITSTWNKYSVSRCLAGILMHLPTPNHQLLSWQLIVTFFLHKWSKKLIISFSFLFFLKKNYFKMASYCFRPFLLEKNIKFVGRVWGCDK